MKKVWLIIFLLLAVAVLSCGCTTPVSTGNTVQGSGTVVYIDLEGGFFGIVADNGERYLPLNLPPELQKDDIRVVFDGVIREDMFTIRQWGIPLDITTIHMEA